MNDTSRIRVLIADDHAVVRKGLRFFLLAYDNLEPVGEASSGEEAVTLCGELRPDVVLMDLMMPGIGGVAAIREIRQRYPAVQVIALTSFVDDQTVQAALKAGAISYLLKNVSADELIEAIQAARIGQAILAPEATQALVQSIADQPRPGIDLTAREKEVLQLMIAGFNNHEIAVKLVIGLSTVKFHVSSVLSKLNASSRTEAVAIALQRHLLA
jgi:NarL family two-component system response regulator LiaR